MKILTAADQSTYKDLWYMIKYLRNSGNVQPVKVYSLDDRLHLMFPEVENVTVEPFRNAGVTLMSSKKIGLVNKPLWIYHNTPCWWIDTDVRVMGELPLCKNPYITGGFDMADKGDKYINTGVMFVNKLPFYTDEFHARMNTLSSNRTLVDQDVFNEEYKDYIERFQGQLNYLNPIPGVAVHYMGAHKEEMRNEDINSHMRVHDSAISVAHINIDG